MRPLAELDLEKPCLCRWPQFEPLAAVPMMVIRGELSDILSAETARAMVERHPNARLHEVAYQGHAPILEDAPTIEAVRAFSRHPLGGATIRQGSGHHSARLSGRARFTPIRLRLVRLFPPLGVAVVGAITLP